MKGLKILSAIPERLLHASSLKLSNYENLRKFATMTSERPEKRSEPHSTTKQSQTHSHKANFRAKNWSSKKSKREKNITEGSSEDVLRLDVQALVKQRLGHEVDVPHDESNAEPPSLPAEGTTTEVEVIELSSTGDGLAVKEGSPQVYVVPFTVPGDIAKVKVFRHVPNQHHTVADFISIVKPSALRDDSRVKCQYFGRCGGCQFQMLDYSEQLKLKQRVLEKAYANFSNLAPELIPTIQSTIGSPLQYDYRTKLTPHFDGPPGAFHGRRNKHSSPAGFPKCPDIGFMLKGSRKTLDIEDCPIGTSAVRIGMKKERERMQTDYNTYQRGATLLLRENTTRYPKDSAEAPSEDTLPDNSIRSDNGAHIDVKTYETNHKAITSEYIGDYIFTNPANSFFQNNNSILPKFTAYIREHVLPASASAPVKYLIDAYSGSGLFTITLASQFSHSTGIDIASDSIFCARRNAELNGLTPQRCNFIAADANELFMSIDYNPDETVVVLDPPRKGCDSSFLNQLRQFGPKRVVYVSCNVHTQARDIGVLVRGEGEGSRFAVESLVGFDFFPQTGHVEGVAILNRVDEVQKGSELGEQQEQ